MTRLAALGEQLDSPLLVTNLTNVLYLCGFDSSNAALLVQPGGETTLYTDFRYAEAAQSVAGVAVEMTKRALTIDVGEQLDGTVQFEADVLPYLEWQRLTAGKAKLVPSRGIVDSVRAIKDEEEVATLRKAARIADRGLDRRVGHKRRTAARTPVRGDRRDGIAGDSRLGCAGRRVQQRLHAHVLDRRFAPR